MAERPFTAAQYSEVPMLPPTPPSVRIPDPVPDGRAAGGAGRAGRAGGAGVTREELDRFAGAATRLLLGSDGPTTPLLEARVGSPVAVRRRSHRLVRAGEAPAGAADLMEIGTGRRRTLVETGLDTWGGEPAAYKSSLLGHGEQPPASVTELFDPAVVPAVLRAPAALAGRP
ncbi:hypothetical protein [Streptomyces sp. NPDC091268]|uniref:hypothetical protein n=1 Tax=Streptomyces sp. NPDC091268 TaxID=3365979 RepID=UPI0037FE77C3